MDVGSLLVQHDPASAATVRHEIAQDLARHQLSPDSIDDVVLVASEMVGNAVTHTAHSELDVAWDVVGDDSVMVRVNDADSRRPRLLEVDAESTSGRGMAIIAAIAREWGVRAVGSGKQVWALVPVRRVA